MTDSPQIAVPPGPRHSPGLPRRLTVCAVGDCLPARRLRDLDDPAFLELVEVLRGADCTWANCETVFFEPGTRAPAAKGMDPHASCPPFGADDLAWLGVDMVGTANNHSMDWGADGLAESLGHLERVGLSHAGAGPDLAAASAVGTLDSPAGRVGQVNACSTFLPSFPAVAPRDGFPGRAGINPLWYAEAVQVDPGIHRRLAELEPALESLLALDPAQRNVFDRYPQWNRIVSADGDDGDGDGDGPASDIAGTVTVPGDGFDVLSRANPADVERITAALGRARRSHRLVLATLHAHEAYAELERPAAFAADFARATIDAGADAFFAAGPHVMRGIEIHRGRPVFHGLANFLFQYESGTQVPAEAFAGQGMAPDSADALSYHLSIPYPARERYWLSFVPRITFERPVDAGAPRPEPADDGNETDNGADDGNEPAPEKEFAEPRLRLASIELFPIELGFGTPVWRRGTPRLARGATARKILERLAELSRPFGTEIAIDGDRGWVVLPGRGREEEP